MIVRNRRAVKPRKCVSKRVRPGQIDFPHIRKQVKLYSEIGFILKSMDRQTKQSANQPQIN